MKNYIQNRSLITFTADQAYTGGQPVKLGSLFGVIQGDVKAGETGVLVTEGVFSLQKGSDEISMGEALAFDAGTGHMVPATGASDGIAVAPAAADNGIVLLRL